MNIFEIIPTFLFIEDEFDLSFVKKYLRKIDTEMNIKIGDIVTSKKQNIYVVKPLDTIKTISEKLGINEELIKKQVSGKNLYIGQKLIF